MSELSEYCQNLVAEGEKDSSGRFTIDMARARDQLSQHLFADPSNYLLKFVQYALARGAAPVVVQTRRHDLQISFEFGSHPDGEEMLVLKELLMEPGKAVHHSHWRDLIFSLYAAQALNPEFLLYASRNGGRASGLLLHHNRCDLVDLPAGPPAELLLIRRTPQDSWFRRLFYSPRHLAQDSASLAQRCRYSWAPLMLDNRLLGASPFQFKGFGYPTLAERIYLSRSPAPRLLSLCPFSDRPALMYDVNGRNMNLDTRGSTILHQWRSYNPGRGGGPALFEPTSGPTCAPESRDSLTKMLTGDSQGICLYRGGFRSSSSTRETNSQTITVPKEGFQESLFSQKALFSRRESCPAAQVHMLCPARPDRDESLLYISLHGVLLDPVPLSLDLKGLRVVISDPEAATDLSGLQLRQDERFQRLCQWVSQEATRLRDELRRVLRFHENLGLSESFVKSVNQVQGLGL